MKKSEIGEYLIKSFEPITLATTKPVVNQHVEEAIRWFDREGADVVFRQFNYNGTQFITLADEVDEVLNVYPSKVVTELFTAQTLLLGVTILDYDIETIALKFAHLSTLRTFLASKFRWRWIKPNLYIAGMTTGVSSVVVQFFRFYDWSLDDQEINGKALDWVLRYARAKTKQSEGRILRMGRIIDAPMDGQELLSEGNSEIAEVKEELRAVRALIPLSRSV